MAKFTSRLSELMSRFVKGLVGLLLIPPVIGGIRGLIQQLDAILLETQPALVWFAWGVASYVITHLFFYKPRSLFRASHAWLGRLAAWLFGGQVTTMGAEGSKESRPAKSKAKTKSGHAKRSTLVVLSPYVVPLPVILVSGLTWLLGRWMGIGIINSLGVFFVGASLAFHLIMTAEDLQQEGQFSFDMYLMALAICSLASVVVLTGCLPMVLPEFYMPGAFALMITRTHMIYSRVIDTLFF